MEVGAFVHGRTKTLSGVRGVTAIVVEAAGLGIPPELLHVRVYVEFVVGLTTSVPDAAFVPVHAPEAVHELAFVEDQVSVEG